MAAMTRSLSDIENKVKAASSVIHDIRAAIRCSIVGQATLVDRLLIGLLTDGHILLEGPPGLAKTLMVRRLSECLDLVFQRIQFTPDLLPADLLGAEIYHPRTGEFSTRKGPLFTQILLADEINRAPPKVQSALLEAMAERQITIGGETHLLPSPFLVLATQNPLEQEGTYPLPEAQADRFMMKCRVDYPTEAEEKEILFRQDMQQTSLNPVAGPEDIMRCKEALALVHLDPLIVDYLLHLVRATRSDSSVSRFLSVGASPRASLALMNSSKAHAFLKGRSYVTPDDVKAMTHDVLRHRILLSFEAEAQGMNADWVIDKILQTTRAP